MITIGWSLGIRSNSTLQSMLPGLRGLNGAGAGH